MIKILFESTKDLYIEVIPKISRIEHLAHAFYCFKNCNQKKLFKGERKKSFKHVRSYAATIEDRINILKHNNKREVF